MVTATTNKKRQHKALTVTNPQQLTTTTTNSTQAKDPKDCQSNVIYSYQCKELHCDDDYIGETSKTLGVRYKEHLKETSPIQAHSTQTGHSTSADHFNILGGEDQGLTRLVKESIYLRVNNPTLNRNISEFNLSHIQDRILINTPGLKLNNNNGQVQAHNNSPLQPIPPWVNCRDSLSML